MQPPEPTSESPVPSSSDGSWSGVPAQRVAPGGLKVGKPRNRRVRLIVAVVIGVVLLLCLGGVGVIVSLYDNATSIKRTAPDAVVDSFLRAYLVDRSDQEASLYTCKSGGDLSNISGLRTELINREKEFDVKVVVTWGSLIVSGSGDARRSANADLTIAGTKNGVPQSRRTESWNFGLVQDDGWRVCSARKVS